MIPLKFDIDVNIFFTFSNLILLIIYGFKAGQWKKGIEKDIEANRTNINTNMFWIKEKITWLKTKLEKHLDI